MQCRASRARKSFQRQASLERGGKNARESEWFHHMPAYRLRKRLGVALWNEYFKFCVVRDPFDRLVSKFVWESREKLSQPDFPIVDTFREQLLNDAIRGGHGAYIMDGTFCLDDFIRFENLQPDIHRICDRLSLPFDSSRLPRVKAGYRPDIPLSEFYNKETIDYVQDNYALDLELFGYSAP